MRVTQSMLSHNMLKNLSSSYSKMGKLQEQLGTGKKVNRPSDDPVVVMKSLGFNTQVDKVEQFKKNLTEVNNWLDSADDALDAVGSILHRTRELSVNAANDGPVTDNDRDKIRIELEQLQEQLQQLANTKVGEKYIFSGRKTDTPLYENKTYNQDPSFEQNVTVEVFDGVDLRVSTNVSKMFDDINNLMQDIQDKPDFDFSGALETIDNLFEDVLTKRADIGARSNRAELMQNRLEMQDAAARKQRSENEDVQYEKAITDLITSESIHRASLSVGSRIIQPSLVDFLR